MTKLYLTLLFIFFVLFALVYSAKVPPKGDEIHYLIATSSILQDHDLHLENNYQHSAYSFLDKIVVRGKNMHDYPAHGIGLSFLIAPVYFFFNRTGVVLFNTILTYALLLLTLKFCFQLTKNIRLSLLAVIALFLSLPLVNFSVLIFPEITAALLILIALKTILDNKNKAFFLFASTLLPWIHIRFLPLSAFLAAFWAIKKIRFLALIPFLSITAYFIFLKNTIGTFNPLTPFNELGVPPTSGNILINLVNSLLDRQYGLLIHAPILIFLFPGAYFWYKKSRKTFLIILSSSLIYLIPVFKNSDWHGGYTPPGRFFVALIPLWTPALVYYFKFRKNLISISIALLFFLYGLVDFLISLLLPPNHGFVYQDGVSPSLWFIYQKTGLNLHQLFPAFYPSSHLNFLHLIWIVLVAFMFLILFESHKITKIITKKF